MQYLTRQSPDVCLFKENGHDEYYRHQGQRGGEAWKLDVGAELNQLQDLSVTLIALENLAQRLHTHINGLNATMRATDQGYAKSELCKQLSRLIADNAVLIPDQAARLQRQRVITSIVDRVAEFEELETED